jgi:hypothetical protein
MTIAIMLAHFIFIITSVVYLPDYNPKRFSQLMWLEGKWCADFDEKVSC